MSNWDEQLRKIRGDAIAAEKAMQERAAEYRQKKAAEERAKREHDSAIQKQIFDVIEWAIGQYRATNTRPVPIYVTWDAWVKPLLRKQYKEKRRIQVGEGYPLLHEIDSIVDIDYGTTYSERFLLITPDRKIIKIIEEKGYSYPHYEYRTTEIELRRYGPVNPKAFLANLTVTLVPESFSSPHDQDRQSIDQICNKIVSNVEVNTRPMQ